MDSLSPIWHLWLNLLQPASFFSLCEKDRLTVESKIWATGPLLQDQFLWKTEKIMCQLHHNLWG